MKVKSESEVAQSCPTLSDPMDCSLPGSSAHGIFQARVLEWVAIAFSDPFLEGRKCTHFAKCLILLKQWIERPLADRKHIVISPPLIYTVLRP